MRRLLVLLALGLALAGPGVLGYHLSRGDRATSPMAIPGVVDEVRAALTDQYYRPVPASVLQLGSVGQMISALGDPYTAYLAPLDYMLLRQQTQSHYSGIGVSVLPAPRGLVVASLRPGPAQRAGVRAGDTIVSIDGVSARDLDMTVRVRPDSRPERLARAPRADARAHARRRRRPAGHRAGAYRRVCAPLVCGAALGRPSARRVPGRRRGCPAGADPDARAETRHRARARPPAEPRRPARPGRGRVVALPRPGRGRLARGRPSSAPGVPRRRRRRRLGSRSSCSSTASARAPRRSWPRRSRTIQRATLVGERTFGKALVQSIDPLGNGAALEITIARYTTPAGRDISGVGVVPAIHAVDDPLTARDEALETALRVLARPTS